MCISLLPTFTSFSLGEIVLVQVQRGKLRPVCVLTHPWDTPHARQKWSWASWLPGGV